MNLATALKRGLGRCSRRGTQHTPTHTPTLSHIDTQNTPVRDIYVKHTLWLSRDSDVVCMYYVMLCVQAHIHAKYV